MNFVVFSSKTMSKLRFRKEQDVITSSCTALSCTFIPIDNEKKGNRPVSHQHILT
jgi:hypothetical protein